MTTPRKRPSVKNKKTVRPAERASISSAGSASESVAQSGDVAAGHTPAETRQDAVASVKSAENPAPSSLDASVASASASSGAGEAPADFFDLADTSALVDGEDDAPSEKRTARPSARKRARAKSARASEGASGSASKGASRIDSAPAKGKGKKQTRTSTAARDRGASKKAGEKGAGRRIVAIVCGVVLGALIAAGGLYVWNTYLRYDDAIDIQGEWQTQDGSMTVVIDATDIRMPDLEYSYEMNTNTKKLTFHFSDLSGSGSYSFSGDRAVLTIVEGEGESAVSTVLVRVSDNIQATPRLLGEGESTDEASADSQTDASSGDDRASGGQGAEGDAGTDGSSSGEEGVQ